MVQGGCRAHLLGKQHSKWSRSWWERQGGRRDFRVGAGGRLGTGRGGAMEVQCVLCMSSRAPGWHMGCQ